MTADYQSILQQQVNAPLASRNDEIHYLIPLPSYGVITVTGEEASGFLQNLLTNDVQQLGEQASQISAMCNPKGRLLAIFVLVKTDNGYHLVLPKSQCAFLAQRLQMFKLRSKVDVIDNSENLHVCGLQGSNAPTSAISLPSQSRALLIATDEQLSSELTVLIDEGWQLAAESSWHIAEIDSGIPIIFPESRELFTAQQLNLDLVGGVSFRKGCYPGQEVVARLHYLGEPKRRLFQALAQTDAIPPIADTIVNDEKAIMGHIVRAISVDDKLFMQLSLKLEGAQQKLYLNDGTALAQVQPYTA